MYVDGKFETYSDFYHGKRRFAVNGDYQPKYEGVDSFLLYSLTSGTTTTFKNIKVCKEKCMGDEDLKFNGAFGRNGI